MEQHQMPPPFSPSSGSSSSSSSFSSSCVSEEQGGDGSYFPHNSIAVPFRWEATPGRPKLKEGNLSMPNIYPLRPPPIPKDFSATQYSRSNSTPTLGEACSIHAKIKKDGRIYDAGTIPIASNYAGMLRKLKDGHFDDRTNPVVSNYGGLLRKKDGRIDDEKTNPVANNYGGTLRKKDGRIDGNRTTPITSNYGGVSRKSGLQSHCKEIQEEEMKQEIEEEIEEVIPWNLPRSGSRGYYDAPSSPMPKLKDVLKESAPAFEDFTPLRRSTTCRKSLAHANANNKPSSSCNPFSLSSQRLGLFLNKSLCFEALFLQNVLGGNKSKSKNKHAKTSTTQNSFLHQQY